MKEVKTLDYYEGYCKAMRDLHSALRKWEPRFKADRKRNNVKNVIWLLECLLSVPDTFAAYVDETPIYYREVGKKTTGVLHSRRMADHQQAILKNHCRKEKMLCQK